jgi:hypothetical protein
MSPRRTIPAPAALSSRLHPEDPNGGEELALATTPEPQPFAVDVPDEVLDDLAARLGRVRWPDEIPGSGWAYGTDLAYLQELITYWRDQYDTTHA